VAVDWFANSRTEESEEEMHEELRKRLRKWAECGPNVLLEGAASDIDAAADALEACAKDAEQALSEAVKIIYFDDSSDFLSALYAIVKQLGGQDAVDLLESDGHLAYEKYCTAIKEKK